MDRAFRLWIVPSVIGLAVTAALGFSLAALWRAAAIDVDYLSPQARERALEDRVYHDRIMAGGERGGGHDAAHGGRGGLADRGPVVLRLLADVARRGGGREPPAIAVAADRRHRDVLQLPGRRYFAMWGSQLSALLMLRPLLMLFAFLVPFFYVIYYAAGMLGTHRVYLPAITAREWRPW